jgi:predicted aspartyl protease
VIYTFVLSLLVCVPLTALEIRRGTALGKGRGGRTLGWFLLPIVFLPGAYAVYSSLASGSGSILNTPSVLSGFGTSGAASQLVTLVMTVSSLLWTAWIPVLVYSGFALDSARSKAGWVARRIAAALVLFLILFVLAVATWYAFGTPGLGVSAPEWVSATSNVLFLVGVSSLVAFLSLFTGFASSAALSLPVLVASFAIPALVRRTLPAKVIQGVQAPPPRFVGSDPRFRVIVRLYGPKRHKDVEMVVDTGATNTNISPSLARDLGISGRFGRFSRIKFADGTVRKSSLAKAVVEYGPSKAQVTIQIAPVFEPLLGFTTLEALGLRVDPAAKRLESSHTPRDVH